MSFIAIMTVATTHKALLIKQKECADESKMVEETLHKVYKHS